MFKIKADEYLRTKKMIDQQGQNQLPPPISPEKYIEYVNYNNMLEQQNQYQYTPPAQDSHNAFKDIGTVIILALIFISYWLPKFRLQVAEKYKPYFWILVLIVFVYTLIHNYLQDRIPSFIVSLLTFVDFAIAFVIMNEITFRYAGGYPLENAICEHLSEYSSTTMFSLIRLTGMVIDLLIPFVTIPVLQMIFWKVCRKRK